MSDTSLPSLTEFLTNFDECAVLPTRRLIAAYVRGCLSALPRKSVLPMARAQGIPPRTLQELLSLHRWDEERLRSILLQQIRGAVGAEAGVGLVRLVVVPKRGVFTPGVARQACPSSGKVRNCCLIPVLAFSSGALEVVVDGGVYLPSSWAEDPSRRRTAGIPEETFGMSPGMIAAGMVGRASAGGLRISWLLLAKALGEEPEALEEIARSGVSYLVEVEPSHIGRRGHRSGRLEDLLKGEPLPVRVSSPSPEEAGGARSFPAGIFPYQAGGDVRGVLVIRHPWSGESRYFLTNAAAEADPVGAAGAALGMKHMERRVDALLEAVGFSHFEVRSYRSLRRHLRLAELSTAYLGLSRAARAKAEAAQPSGSSEDVSNPYQTVRSTLKRDL